MTLRVPTGWFVGFLVVVVSPLSGCMAGGSDEGQVSFFVKDAPSDEFQSVFVTFSRVDVHRAGGSDNESNVTESPEAGNQTAGNETEEPDNDNATAVADDGAASSWVTIVNATQTIDLKQFQGDARAFLGSENITAGKYTQIRIYVDEAYGLSNGTRVDFTVPSGALKIVRPWTVEAGLVTELTVDFELDRSIVKTAQGEYRLKPVMKLTVDHHGPEEDSEAGEEEGARGRPTAPTRPYRP